METLDRPGLNAAMRRRFDAYAPLRADQARLLAADVFIVEDVMVNSIYVQGLRALARLCRAASDADAGEFDALAGRVMRALVSKCYDERVGIFFDRCGTREVSYGVKTITSLFPLILEDLDPAIAQRLVDDHLHNPAEFWLPYPLPSVAADEPTFDPEAKTGLLWRGSTWINTNWFLVAGLRLHGYDQIANELIERTLAMVRQSGFREYYSPYTGKGDGAPDFGWSTLILDFLPQK
jgi:glycogen debranching enzyme